MLQIKHMATLSLLTVSLYCDVARNNVTALDAITDKSSHVFLIKGVNYNGQSGKNASDSEENYIEYRVASEGRKGGKKDEGFLQKVLPFMVIPFMISSSIIPVALTMLKFMLIKSAFIGKMAIILLIANMFLRFNKGGGVYSHNISLSPPEKDVAMLHYGYNGNEEYGAYIHSKKRR